MTHISPHFRYNRGNKLYEDHGVCRSEVKKLKRKNKSESSVKKTEQKSENESVKEQEKKEEPQKIMCKDCKYLDSRTIRDFARNGIRQGLVERRGKCTGNVRAKNHLVRIDMPKVCEGFEKGTFEIPKEEPKKAKKKGTKKAMTDKEADEYAEKFVEENINNVPEKSLERKNGDVVILEKRKGKTYVRPVNQ